MDDVRRALDHRVSWCGRPARADVERTFSFDMEWVAPNDSEAVVDALLSTGWLEEREHQLHVAADLGQVDVLFGWFPRPTRLLKPVSATGSGDVKPQIDDAAPSPPPHARTPPTLRTEANISGEIVRVPRSGLLALSPARAAWSLTNCSGEWTAN